MGKRDFHPLSANFLLAKHLKSHWTNYAKGKAEAGAKADVADWRVARTIFVADDDKIALRYGREDANSPYRFYFEQMRAKMKRGNRLYVFKSHKEQPDEEITARFRHGQLRVPRHASTRWSIRSWRCARRPAISANWSMPAWTGSIRRSPSARCS